MNQSPSLGETMSGMLLGHLDPNMDDVIEGPSPRREGLTEKEKESLERLKPRTADRIGTGDYSIGYLKQDMDDADTTQDIRKIARGLHDDLKPGILRSLGIPMNTKILGISEAPDGIFDLWHTDKIFQEAFPERYAELKKVKATDGSIHEYEDKIIARTKADPRISTQKESNSITNILITNIRHSNDELIYRETAGYILTGKQIGRAHV